MLSLKRLTRLGFSILIFAGFFSGNTVIAQDGKTLFQTNCASCHQVHKKLTGPALAGVEDRWPNKKNLYAWIRNSAAFLKTGDAYANNLYNEYNKVAMNQFPGLTDGEIDAMLAYIKSVPAPGTGPVGGAATVGAPAEEGDNTLLFGVLTLILAVVALTLLQVNSNLRKMADEKEGINPEKPVSF
jgi:mono/diheme cytochrome c family protein